MSTYRDDQRAETGHGTVDSVRRRHHDEDKPDLDVEQGLPELRALELGAADARLAQPQPLDGGELFPLGQEPGGDGRAGDGEAEEAEQKGQRPGEQIDILPALQAAARDLGEAVVEGAADDGPPARGREPPALAQRLLALRVAARDDGHEARRDDALDEAEEEALRVQAAVRRHGRRQQAHERPGAHDGAEGAPRLEALQRVRHGVEARQHAKVEKRRRPRQPRRVDHGRVARAGHTQLQVGRHAEQRGRTQYGL